MPPICGAVLSPEPVAAQRPAPRWLRWFGGLLIAVFAGWIMPYSAASRAVGASTAIFNLWRFLIRIIIPPAIAGILLWFLFAG